MPENIDLYALLIAALHLAGAVCALRAAARAHTAQGAVAWAMALLAAPWAALPAYALFGPPDFAWLGRGRRAARETALALAKAGLAPCLPPDAEAARLRAPLERLGPLPTLAGPAPALLCDRDAFEAMFAAIATAERSLNVQFYIMRDDAIGRRFADALAARAQAGVAVRLLYDRVGARNASDAYWERLTEAGVSVRPFDIRSARPQLYRLNFRNHRKAVVADGRRAIIGGPNVGDEYLGRDHRFGRWRDTAVRLEGAPARAVEASFLEDWIWAGGAPPSAPLAPPTERGDVPVLLLPTGPADSRPGGSLMLLHLITVARERLWIASPYFVPDLDVMTALKLAALRGVDVRILIPERPDHLVVWLAGFAYAEEALRAGVRLHRYTDGFMHQKAMVVDEAVGAVGTANLDNRSLRLNFELTALVFDRRFAGEVATMLEADLARSRRYDEAAHARRPLRVRLLAPAARLLGPLL